MRTCSRLHLLPCLSLLVAAATAQAPQGPGIPADVTTLGAAPAAGSPAEVRARVARDALAAGKAAEAVVPLLDALQLHPASSVLLTDMVRATADDADARAIWLLRWLAAAADATGKPKLDAAQRKLVPADELASAGKLVELRAQAAVELSRAADKLKGAGKQALGNGVRARWLGQVFLALAADMPAVIAQHGPLLQQALDRQQPEWDLVFAGLARVMATTPRTAAAGAAAAEAENAAREADVQRDRAIRAARVIAGLARQASYGKDLKGPPPPALGKLPTEAAALLAKADAEGLAAARIWTVAELEALTPAEAEAFTLRHSDWSRPALATSLTGRYRIETICGHATLLGAARTVELHHARLVAHFGSDPFVTRPGTVRIVPQHDDMETEGAPFFWAAGFQGGDRTVVRFAWGSIPGLGRLLTHELTHRFDGVMHGFAPAWYTEGHATWTGSHYAKMADRNFTEDRLDAGTCATVFAKNYGSKLGLMKLLSGKVEDYRDNYPAGYALYAFLRGWPPKEQPRFRSALERFETTARGGQKDPVGFFTAVFCDGKEGRPATFDEFVQLWHDFLAGCYRWQDPEQRKLEDAWVATYGSLPEGDPAPMVMDSPTWSWDRDRTEPFFGDGHASDAAAVLAEAGEAEASAAAWLWSLQCEGWSVDAARGGVAQLLLAGRKEAAAALAALARLRYGSLALDPVDATTLTAPLQRVRAAAEALRAQVAEHATAGHVIAAADLARGTSGLDVLLGTPPAAPSASAAAPPETPRAVGWGGWTESSLTGHDQRRQPGLWYATADGDLHVGREKPREATGVRDRAAYQRDAFAHSSAWCGPGDYVIRARIHFTTSYVNGAVVLGHWRRDRGLRVQFQAGSARYASGKDDAEPTFRAVSMQLRGLWERDGQMPQSSPAATIELDSGASWFDLELHVQGPSVLVKANGQVQFRYTSHDGAPVEGHLGFAMGRGAIRVQGATCEVRGATMGAQGLDVSVQPSSDLDGLLMMPTRGIPLHEDGTLVLWLPTPTEDSLGAEALYRSLPVLAKLLKDTTEFPQTWILALPVGTDESVRQALQASLGEFRPAAMPWVEHRVGAPFTGNPWVLFVDAGGVLRAAAETGDVTLHSRVQKWARMFRGALR